MVRLTQIAQYAGDLDRAAAFYTELLGAPPTGRFDPPGLLFFDLDGVRLLLDRGAPSSLLYFPSNGIDSDVQRLTANGAVPDTAPHMVFSHEDDTLGPAGTDEWQAFLRDPEGNLFALVEQRTSAEPDR